jgi:CO/xanthine dehydrogenase FAD-binding subunit
MVKVYNPKSLKEALNIRQNHLVTPYAGGTDLMVHPDPNQTYLFLNKIPEIKNIVEDSNYIRIGACCTFADILKSPIPPTILKDAINLLASPAIRNFGTPGGNICNCGGKKQTKGCKGCWNFGKSGGNICNGSDKSDSAVVFFATNSKLRIASSTTERIIPISDFYCCDRKDALATNELLLEILMDRNDYSNYYYKKVGARESVSLSRVAFAAIINIDSSNIITNLSTAFGAVSNVIISEKQIDKMLIGKTIDEAKKLKSAYLSAYERSVKAKEGRVSSNYRKSVCLNLLGDFLETKGI